MPAPSRPAAAGLGTTSRHAEDRARWEKRLRRALGDDYELLGLLGTGGFGRVYRVRDLQLEREVALKVLHPLADPGPGGGRAVPARGPARGPARPPQHRQHLRYRRPVGVDLVHDGVDRRAQPGPAGGARRARCRSTTCSGCCARRSPRWRTLTAPGLVHRDIKPENMLIAPDGSLQITDFGLALALRGKFGGATSQSGTPQFASPEQLLGSEWTSAPTCTAWPRSRISRCWARPPFPGLTVGAGAREADHQPAPDARAAREMCSDALERVLDRALQRGRRGALSVRGGVPAGGEPGRRRTAGPGTGGGLGPGGGTVAPRLPP